MKNKRAAKASQIAQTLTFAELCQVSLLLLVGLTWRGGHVYSTPGCPTCQIPVPSNWHFIWPDDA